MPGNIKAALHKYQHAAPARLKHAPRTWNPPIYGAKKQYVEDESNNPTLSDKEVNKLQQLTGTLLYYARAVDPALIMPINVLASEQSKATAVTAEKVIKLLNYCNTHPETKIRYHASDMILYIHSDASYLSENEAKNRAGGFFYMGSSTNTAKIRGNFDQQQSSQTHNVFGSGSKNWSSFYKCKRRSSPSYNTGRVRASTAPHTNGNRQYHFHMIQQWHNKTKTHKSNGYAFLLDQRQSETRTN
jgi:hypothetical protein